MTTEQFQWVRFGREDRAETQTLSPTPANLSTILQQVTRLISSIRSVEVIIGPSQWRSWAFADLDKLTLVACSALNMGSETERFHRLVLLRAWMLWFDVAWVANFKRHVLWKVLACQFYLSILAVVPLFPARYSCFAERVRVRHIKGLYRSTNLPNADDVVQSGPFEQLMEITTWGLERPHFDENPALNQGDIASFI